MKKGGKNRQNLVRTCELLENRKGDSEKFRGGGGTFKKAVSSVRELIELCSAPASAGGYL